MPKRKILLSIVWLLILPQVLAQFKRNPNIVLIVADDLGYSDLGCYGGEINTPNLDGLATKGVRLSNMNNAGMCVISRSSLLTGQWWPKTGFGIEKEGNLAEMLKERNYCTGLIGKWHLNGNPMDKGFDYFFGFLGGYASYFNGSPDYRMNNEPFNDFGEDYYSTDAFSEHAIRFIEAEGKNENHPFFLYLNYQAPHNPLQAPKEEIMSYRGSYLKGWQAVRDLRIEKQKETGIILNATPLPDYPENLPEWNTLSPAQKNLEDLRMSVYAAMVEHMDKGIGQVLQALKRNGHFENTLILFVSDNGTDSFSVMDKTLLKKGLLPGDEKSNFQPGTGWAYACVSPFRLYKISQHNGGVRTGAIAFWPKGILNEGTIRNDPIHFVDIAPTILEIVSGKDKTERHKEVTNNFSGRSFLPVLKGEKWERKSPMFFQFMDNRAIRTGDWSLVEVDDGGWELYHVNNDPLETIDLAAQRPGLVRQLEKKWMRWWKTTNGSETYEPKSTASSPHYKPQGDRGTGIPYSPSEIPKSAEPKYPIDQD